MSFNSSSYGAETAVAQWPIPVPTPKKPRETQAPPIHTPRDRSKSQVDASLNVDALTITTENELRQAFESIDQESIKLKAFFFDRKINNQIKYDSDIWLVDHEIPKAVSTSNHRESLPELRKNHQYIEYRKYILSELVSQERPQVLQNARRLLLGIWDPHAIVNTYDYEDLQKKGKEVLRRRLVMTAQKKQGFQGKSEMDIYDNQIELAVAATKRIKKLRAIDKLRSDQNFSEQQIAPIIQEIEAEFYSVTDVLLHDLMVSSVNEGNDNTYTAHIEALKEHPLLRKIISPTQLEDAYVHSVLHVGNQNLDTAIYNIAFAELTATGEAAPIIVCDTYRVTIRNYFNNLLPSEYAKLLNSQNPGLQKLSQLYQEDSQCLEKQLENPVWTKFVAAYQHKYGEAPLNVSNRYDDDLELKAWLDGYLQQENISLDQIRAMENYVDRTVNNPKYPAAAEAIELTKWYLIANGSDIEKLKALEGLKPIFSNDSLDFSYSLPELGGKTGYGILVDVMLTSQNALVRKKIASFWLEKKNFLANPLFIYADTLSRDLTDYIYLIRVYDQNDGVLLPELITEEQRQKFYSSIKGYLDLTAEGSPWRPLTLQLTTSRALERVMEGEDLHQKVESLNQYQYLSGYLRAWPNADWTACMMQYILLETPDPNVLQNQEKVLSFISTEKSLVALYFHHRLWQRRVTNEYLQIFNSLLLDAQVQSKPALCKVVLDSKVVQYLTNQPQTLPVLREIIIQASNDDRTANLITANVHFFAEFQTVSLTLPLYEQISQVSSLYSHTDVLASIRKYSLASLIDFTSVGDLQLFTQFAQEFGIYYLPKLFAAYKTMVGGGAAPDLLKPIGVTKNGKEGLVQLRGFYKKVVNNFNVQGNTEDLVRHGDNELVVEIFSTITRFKDSEWSRSDANLGVIAQNFAHDVKRNNRLTTVPPEYTPATIAVRPMKEKEGFSIVADATNKYQEYWSEWQLAISGVKEGEQPFLRSLKNEVEKDINNHIEQISSSKAPEKIRTAQIDAYQKYQDGRGLLDVVRQTETVGNLVTELLNFASQKENKFGVKIVLGSPVRKALFFQSAQMNPELYGIDRFTKFTSDSQSVTVEVLEDMVRVINSGILDDVARELQLTQFSAFETLREKNLSTQVFKDEIARSKELDDGVEEFEIYPNRDLRLELSGYGADACWTRKRNIVKDNPTMIDLPYGKRKGETVNIIGHTLLIEGHLENGEEAIVVRGMDPRENFIRKLSAEDFFERNIDQIEVWIKQKKREGFSLPFSKKKNQKRRVHILIPPSDGGAFSNRDSLIEYAKERYDNRPQVQLKERVAFNDYDITNKCRIVRTIELE